jgi:hypothetical protein
VAATLDDGEAAAVARACCDRRFCLKQRLWTSPGLAPDSAAEKSAIPCLEPCALLIETARQAGLLEQARRGEFGLGAEEVETARIALAAALGEAAPAVREGDLGSPANPRRMRLLLERLNELPPAGPRPETDD